MGIIARQSIRNLISSYAGFFFGAINTLLLYPYFLTDAYFGLIGFLLSTANIMMPLLAFGVPNTLVKFFSSYKTDLEKGKFTFLMLFLPLCIVVPIGIIGVISYQEIGNLLSAKNEIIEGYIWIIYVIAIAMAYFEVFYAWAKIHMKSVFGNFLKEVFHRVVIMILLLAIHFNLISMHNFITAIAIMYLVRTILMMFNAFSIQKPILCFNLPDNYRKVLSYSGLIILAGSVAVILLDIDKFMLGQYIAIENIAFYNVAIFIAMVIIVPSRAMHQITYPITAALMNNNNKQGLADLYKRSSLTLFVVSGLLFLLITLNIKQLYFILPPQYSQGLWVVLFISIAKLSDSIIGNNNSIIFNSDYYRMMLLFGVFLAIITIFLNMIFIPLWGINGSAFATLLAFLCYNGVKIWFVHHKFKIHPFSRATLKILVIVISFILLFFLWDFNFHPILNIVLKSVLIGAGYLFLILKLSISEDISGIIRKYIK
ncbi:lipopolysaccharide biosynthesis protein [Ascidiimonas sp. W6]|uniref:lipopolysaccharide biosynthesis protein n=1 Tax=Ascidiimonas meishanensis TaxID=3128903 RepID=UPI0030EF87F1